VEKSLTDIEFLGHHLSTTGISPLPSRVQAIAVFPQPATVKQLQVFLELFNFYRRFIPPVICIVLPLTHMLHSSLK
jgi:hypothetical protein